MREISVNIASASGPDDARKLLEKAIAYYDTGVVNEHGHLIMGDPGGGCVQVYVWAEE